MRWEDERYVRVYTRDTSDWLGLSFVAQGLLCLLLRKVDRAGILDLGKQGKRSVAIVIGHAGDWARLEPALEELLADGCVRVEGGKLIVPNFIEAQEASMSDAQRQREHRARARDIASQNVTPGHETGQNVTSVTVPVTSGHAVSQPVTPSLPNQPSQPSREEEAMRSSPERALERLGGKTAVLSAKYPLTASLMALLSFDAGWPKDGETRESVERSLSGQNLEDVASRVEGSYLDNQKRWLGWHLDAINGVVPKRPVPVDAWTPNPGLDVDPDEAERRWLNSPERRAAIERGEIQA